MSSESSIPAFPETFNMATYFLDERIAEGGGARIAVSDDRGSYSYAQVHDLAGRLCALLWSGGVRPEDRCLIGLPDSVAFASAFFGVLKAGAVVAMVNNELPDSDYAYYLQYTRCRALIADAALLRRIAPLLPQAECLRLVIALSDDPDDPAAEALPSLPVPVYTWAEAAAIAPRPTYPSHRDDPAVWLFTSGSTGKPKAAVHLHHDFPYNTEGYAKQVLHLRPDDVTLGVPKLYFGYATGTNLLFPFAVGARTVLFRDRATPERLGHLIRQHGATVLTSVPTMINKMLEHDAERAHKGGEASQGLRPLRVCISAGEALPEELYRRFVRSYGVEILDGIGSAELFHIYISNRLGEVRPGSLGRLVPGYQARVVRPDGNDAAPGEIGALWIRGDSAALCYWQAHEKSKHTLRGDWVVSEDLFYQDEEGYFYFAGRADDLLKISGIYVSPLEVESVLLEHPAVLEVALVGEENEVGLTRGLAYVVPRSEGLSESEALALTAELIRHVKARLAHYKAPSRIEFLGALPRSDRGKVLRRVLRGTTGV